MFTYLYNSCNLATDCTAINWCTPTHLHINHNSHHQAIFKKIKQKRVYPYGWINTHSKTMAECSRTHPDAS